MDTKKLIADYAAGVDDITSLIKSLPEKSYDFMPSKADDWSIRQHIIHLVDCEVNNYIRIKSCIAQPYSKVYVINELDWTRNLDNRKEDIDDYLALFSLIRKIISSFLKSVQETDFSNTYFIKEEHNETKKVTLAEAVQIYCKHVQMHIDYINKIYAEYKGN
jgi:hypothetical protein